MDKKTLKNATLDQLKSWLLETEMSNSYTKYEETIKAIRAEIDKRNGIKKPRKSKPRKAQEITLEMVAYSNEKQLADFCNKATVKAIDGFLKKSGLKVKRSLRKAEKINAIIENMRAIKAMSTVEKFKTFKAGKMDKASFLSFCGMNTLLKFAQVMKISEKMIRDNYHSIALAKVLAA